MEITEVRTREDMINNLKANGNYSKFKQNMAASRKAYSERMANYKISKSKENASKSQYILAPPSPTVLAPTFQ